MQLCSSLNILWHCLSLWWEWKQTFSSPVANCWVFQICWHIECNTFTASSFRIWNSSTGILTLSLAFLVVMFPKAHWLHIPGCLALGEWSHHHDYLGHEDLFYTVLLYILALFLISSASVRSLPFMPLIVPIFTWNVPLVSLMFNLKFISRIGRA